MIAKGYEAKSANKKVYDVKSAGNRHKLLRAPSQWSHTGYALFLQQ